MGNNVLCWKISFFKNVSWCSQMVPCNQFLLITWWYCGKYGAFIVNVWKRFILNFNTVVFLAMSWRVTSQFFIFCSENILIFTHFLEKENPGSIAIVTSPWLINRRKQLVFSHINYVVFVVLFVLSCYITCIAHIIHIIDILKQTCSWQQTPLILKTMHNISLSSRFFDNWVTH